MSLRRGRNLAKMRSTPRFYESDFSCCGDVVVGDGGRGGQQSEANLRQMAFLERATLRLEKQSVADFNGAGDP